MEEVLGGVGGSSDPFPQNELFSRRAIPRGVHSPASADRQTVKFAGCSPPQMMCEIVTRASPLPPRALSPVPISGQRWTALRHHLLGQG